MTSITSGNIFKSKTTYNSSEASLKVTVNGNAIDQYVESFRVINPAGFFSIPMPGRMAIIQLTPHGSSGIVFGFINEAPAQNNNITDLVEGESGICETAKFNFNIKAKLDKLLSTFTNSDNQTINSNILISENVITFLKDLIAELISFESAYNGLVNTFNGFIPNFANHTHGGVQTGTGSTLGTATSFPTNATYTSTPNFNRDNTFINLSPSKMYININGKLVE